MTDTLAIVLFVATIYFTGFSLLTIFFNGIVNKLNLFFTIGLSWLLGNSLVMVVLMILGYTNNLHLVSSSVLLPTLAVTAVITLVGLTMSVKKVGLNRNQLYSLIVMGLFLAFFGTLILNSLNSFLIDWDAPAIWFIKAKSLFVFDGFWNNTYFQDTGNYNYSNKAYPVGIPLISAAFSRLVGFFNDQTIQFYFLQYFLNIIFIAYAFLRQRLPKMSRLFALVLSMGFFISPTYLIYAHNGYMDLPLSLVFMTSMTLFTMLLDYSILEKYKGDLYVLIILVGALGASIKNEGLIFFGVITLLSTVVLLSYLRNPRIRKSIFRPARIVTYLLGLTLAVLPIIIWRYFLQQIQLPFYLDGQTLSVESLGKIKFILNHYVDMLFDTSIHSITVIPALLLMIFQYTILASRKKLVIFLPSIIIALQLAAYTYVYMITPVPLNLQLQTSFERLLLHILPAFFVIVVFQQSLIKGEIKRIFK